MRLAITGTPGTGKTTLCDLLRQRGWRVVTVEELAQQHGCVVGRDEDDDAQVVDVEALAEALEAAWHDRTDARDRAAAPARLAIDGHLSHLLPVDEVWVLRLDPEPLGQRLAARGYPAPKVAENVEAEALDLILQEALEPEDPPRRVVQRDATLRSAEELLSAFERRGPGPRDLEHVDWSHRLYGP